MAFIVRTINGDTIDESTFEDCKYAVEVFTLLTVLRYRVKNLYEEADIVLYYNNISKLIKRDSDLKDLPSDEIKDATLVIHFKNQVPMAYATTFQTNAMDYDVIETTRNVTPEYLDHSVSVPMVVIDNIRQQVVNMEESLKKIEEQQSKDEEKHIELELSQLLNEKANLEKSQEKLAEIAHGYYYYKKHLSQKSDGKPIMKYGNCLKNILCGLDEAELCANVCKSATVVVELDNHILNVTLKTHQGHFPANQELVILDNVTKSELGSVDLTGIFPYEGITKRLKYFPLPPNIDIQDILVKIRKKGTSELLLIGQGLLNTKIHMHHESETVYTPPVSRDSLNQNYNNNDNHNENEEMSTIDLHGLQSETTKLYQEILRFENDNNAGKSIISEEEDSVPNSGNWEDYDFLSDSSV